MIKIILTGPESSGKTTIGKQLAKYFQKPLIKEYAREYINKLNRKYDKEDLLKIAKEQLNLEKINDTVIFCDTDLITIKIWEIFKYKTCNQWTHQQIEKQKIEKRFYLLCKPDIPWEYDSQRESPDDREKLFQLYETEINNLNHNYFIVQGKNRIDNAISKVSSLINNI